MTKLKVNSLATKAKIRYAANRVSDTGTIMRNILRTVICLSLLALFFAVPLGAHAEDAAANPAATTEEAAPAADAVEAVPATSPIQFNPENIRGHAVPWQLGYQDAATPVMEQFHWFHNYLLWIITAISVFVLGLLVYIVVRFNRKSNPVPATFTHNAKIEFIWTVIPIIILIAIVIPSLRIHYDYSDSETSIKNADMTLKVVGNQWYWNYEYPKEGIKFDSYMKKDADLLPGEPRLLAVDNPIVVPVNTTVRVQVTGADVIHSWAVPAFGVKQDTVPGRLNETWFKATKEGIYYGQCSELCGKYHGFMPIEVHVVSKKLYKQWVAYAKTKFAADDSHQVAGVN
jgi:cytochrome c oxidase subunit 2